MSQYQNPESLSRRVAAALARIEAEQEHVLQATRTDPVHGLTMLRETVTRTARELRMLMQLLDEADAADQDRCPECGAPPEKQVATWGGTFDPDPPPRCPECGATQESRVITTMPLPAPLLADDDDIPW